MRKPILILCIYLGNENIHIDNLPVFIVNEENECMYIMYYVYISIQYNT